MSERNLTRGQLIVLQAACRPEGVSKGITAGQLWRNFDQLERRGLISLRNWGLYVATERGRKIVSANGQ